MLLRSEDNLYSNTAQFINSSNSVTLYSAYLRTEQLKKLNESGRINRIIVRWEIQDLCLGVSDMELFSYCMENRIALYRNTRLHMKAFWDGESRLLFGSANVTGRGIGEAQNCNYELNGIQEGLTFEDNFYLNKVIAKSEYVTQELFDALKKIKDETIIPIITYPKLDTKKKLRDYFLISQLPMFSDISSFARAYENVNDLDDLDRNCLSHDLNTFNIGLGQNSDLMLSQLKVNFNSHEFIIAFKNEVKGSSRGASMAYGAVVRWIQENTTTVPTPRSWELKQEKIVNILYEWICFFDAEFTWDTPNHSQVIYYKG